MNKKKIKINKNNVLFTFLRYYFPAVGYKSQVRSDPPIIFLPIINFIFLVGLNNIYFFYFFMKIQTYIHNRTLVLEEDLDESFKAYRVHLLTRMHNLHTYFNIEIYRISFWHFFFYFKNIARFLSVVNVDYIYVYIRLHTHIYIYTHVRIYIIYTYIHTYTYRYRYKG